VSRPAPQARRLPEPRRIVIKIGSAVIAPGGELAPRAVNALSDQIVPLIARGIGVTVVSSGAVASGFRALGLDAPPKTIAAKQAAAAVGQPRLIEAWARAFAHHGRAVAQVLYTADDLDDRARFLNARTTLNTLLDAGATPIVNENDTTSFAEIKLGDNDRLSALTANLVSADLLIILSTAHGLYEDGDPKRIVPTVADADDAARHVQPEKSATGVGGMATKLSSAALAAGWGIPTIVAGGAVPSVLPRLLAGEPLGTLFEARTTRAGARKRWLSGSARARGVLRVDDGAARAITSRGASLLPSGILAVSGRFERGAAVDIARGDGAVFARGLVNFSADEIAAIRGKRSAEIERVLGYCYCAEVVHRDDLVLVSVPGASA
jgi:glutamate 5-kinase